MTHYTVNGACCILPCTRGHFPNQAHFRQHVNISGLIGFPFVLPDMIGGNAYVVKPDEELFVRWAQANVFMPALQFSILPWNYGDQVRLQ